MEGAKMIAPTEQQQSRPRIVVIGAGLAGLRCAQCLRENKAFDGVVVVLEAADYLGGRIRQDKDFVCGVKLEVGAEFLHGSTTSLSRLVETEKWEVQELFTWAQGDGGPIPSADNNGGYALYYLGNEKKLLPWNSTDPDFVHLNDLFDSMSDTDPEALQGDRRSILRYLQEMGVSERVLGMAQAGYANTAGGRLEDVSYSGACHMERGWVANDGEGDRRLEKTFGVVVDHLCRGLTTVKDTTLHDAGEGADSNSSSVGGSGHIAMTSWVVSAIDYSSSDVVHVHCKDGRVMEATHVVVTVPVSVLKDGDITFKPELSVSKTQALEGFGMDRMIKLMLTFDEMWFDVKLHGIICADCFWPEFWFRPLEGQEGLSLGIGSDEGRSTSGRPIRGMVSGFASSSFADVIAAEGEREAIKRALAQLDEMFGVADKPEPASSSFLAGKLYDWKDHAFIRGGYCYPTIAYTAKVPLHLAEIAGQGRLFFAGEHTEEASCTVHAAYDSGTRVAREVVQAITSGPHTNVDSGKNSSSRSKGLTDYNTNRMTLCT